MPTRKLSSFPHEGVYTELLASKANPGKAGVFAIVPIAKDSDAFPAESGTLCWVSERELLMQNLPTRIIEIYERFGTVEGDRRYTYPNFGKIEQSAYIADERRNPNLRYGDDDRFYALRRIKPDEELTVDYSTIGE